MQIIKALRKHKKDKSSNRKVKARLIKNNKVSGSILTNINNIHSKLPHIALTNNTITNNTITNNTRNVDIHQLSIRPNRTLSPYDEHLHKPNCVCFIILFVIYFYHSI